jgi:D-lactate dehydrogenase (cytochrome)
LSLAAFPTLFVELDGSPVSVAEQVDTVRGIFSDAGGMDVDFASSADERSRLWRARHQMHYALLAQRPGSKSWSTDACVPISKLPECVAAISADIEGAPFPVSLVGHVGDGNFHLGFLLDTGMTVKWRRRRC